MKQGFGQSFEQNITHELPHSLELAHKLEETDNDEEIRENLGEMLRSIEEDLGHTFISKVGELYRGMEHDDCLVRVERLTRVLETIELDKTMQISDEHEGHYANAVIPKAQGIKIALSEGQAPGPVRIMVGFGKTIIGFKIDHLAVSEIEFDDSDIRDVEERKYLCRHVTGELKKDDIKYVIIRIPSQFVKEEYMTAEEISSKPPFIFRGMKL